MLYALLTKSVPPWALGALAIPTNVTAPVVTGTGYIGYILTATNGVWASASPLSFTYQWQRSGVDIPLATTPTYTVTLADEGLPVRCVVTATNSAGSASADSNAIEQWVPTDAAAVDGWWDAFSPSTITLATGISQWSSRGSKAGGDVTQSTATKQPAYGATAWDGVRPCATFDGTDDVVRNGTSGTWARNVAGVTVAGSLSNTLLGLDRTILAISIASSTLARVSPYVQPASGGQFGTAGRRLDTDSFFRADDKPFAPGDHLFVAQYDHANNRARSVVDGAVGSWASPFRGAGNTSNTANSALSLGANASGSGNYWAGKIAEVVYYDSTLSDANIDKLNGYLAWRWGKTALLPALHPWKTSAPTP